MIVEIVFCITRDVARLVKQPSLSVILGKSLYSGLMLYRVCLYECTIPIHTCIKKTKLLWKTTPRYKNERLSKQRMLTNLYFDKFIFILQIKFPIVFSFYHVLTGMMCTNRQTYPTTTVTTLTISKQPRNDMVSLTYAGVIS